MAALSRVGSIKMYFAPLKDPRVRKRTRHHLFDIIAIALCGVIANCDGWTDILDFAHSHVDWLKGLLGPLHVVSAWATKANLSLGEVAVEGKSNEIKAIPELLKLLHLKGALVTIDAMGCQKAIAEQIVAKGGDYLLAVKANQEHLLDDIQATVTKALDGELPEHQSAQVTTQTEGHGRKEQRSYLVITNLDDIRDRKLWAGLTTVGMCLRERTVNGKTTEEVHYFIGSGRLGPRKVAHAMQGHWGIENNLHWHLDVHLGEDKSRIQDRNASRNFATMRKLALCVLKRHPAEKSIPRKRKLAAQNPDFLVEIITGAGSVDKV